MPSQANYPHSFSNIIDLLPFPLRCCFPIIIFQHSPPQSSWQGNTGENDSSTSHSTNTHQMKQEPQGEPAINAATLARGWQPRG